MDCNKKQGKVAWKGRHLNMIVRNGWEYVERPDINGIVGIIGVTDNKELVLVEQFRPAVNARTIELPAGLSGDEEGFAGESFEKAARREMFEETGYECEEMIPLFDGVTSPGMTNEKVDFYLAKRLKKNGPGGGDENEDIIVHEIPLSNLIGWLKARKAEGCVVDLKIYSALFFCDGTGSYGNGE